MSNIDVADSYSGSKGGISPLLTGEFASKGTKRFWRSGLAALALLILGILVWQGLTASGNPDPSVKGIDPVAAVIDTGILVFREGLEAILVLTALTASLVRTDNGYWKPVATGAGLSFLASIVTWFVVVGVISDINAPALDIQAATGLLAILVLMVIMNWFFHKIYWAGWITLHNRRKRALTERTDLRGSNIMRGLLLIGFTSVYREGFEVVLFLQQTRLQCGSHVVLLGTLIGLTLTLIVALLTFVAHYKLPYKRMLVLTGVMLGGVMLVMVGESVQEMQQANWLPAHAMPFSMPQWLNVWFAVFPTWESLGAQFFAAVFVVGSYYLARRGCLKTMLGQKSTESCVAPDCKGCAVHSAHAAETRVPLSVNLKPAQEQN